MAFGLISQPAGSVCWQRRAGMPGAGGSESIVRFQTPWAFLVSVTARDLSERREPGRGERFRVDPKGCAAGVNQQGISSLLKGRNAPGVGSQQRLKHLSDSALG